MEEKCDVAEKETTEVQVPQNVNQVSVMSKCVYFHLSEHVTDDTQLFVCDHRLIYRLLICLLSNLLLNTKCHVIM